MGQDVYENEMRVVNGVDYIRGLVGKDSVVITPANLLSDSFQERGGVSDANEAIKNGIYSGFNMENAPDPDYSDIVVFRYMGYIHQLLFTLNSDRIFYRKSLNSGTSWYGWKSITLT